MSGCQNHTGSLKFLHFSDGSLFHVPLWNVPLRNVFFSHQHQKIFNEGLEFFTRFSISIQHIVALAVGADKYFIDAMCVIVLSGARHTEGEGVPAGEPSHPCPHARYGTGDFCAGSLELVNKTSATVWSQRRAL